MTLSKNGFLFFSKKITATTARLVKLPRHVDFPHISSIALYILELDGAGKVRRVLIGLGKTIVIFGLLYLFICSLDLLASSFRLLGGKAAGKLPLIYLVCAKNLP